MPWTRPEPGNLPAWARWQSRGAAPAEPGGAAAAPAAGLAGADVERYSRQLLLPSFGVDAQLALAGSTVAVVRGAGRPPGSGRR